MVSRTLIVHRYSETVWIGLEELQKSRLRLGDRAIKWTGRQNSPLATSEVHK